MTQVISAEKAVQLVHDGDTLAHSGFVGFGLPDYLLKTLRDRYDRTGTPKNLTLVKIIGDSDKKGKGSDRLAADGLVHTLITSHTGLEPAFSQAIEENKCYAYMLPLGVLVKLFRAQAAHQPGVWTETGLTTFIDPRLEGGKANELTREKGPDRVQLTEVNGKEYLFFPSFPIQICFLRGTYADEEGNISLEKEALQCDVLEMAAATHNSGGIVIVQVASIVARGSLDPRLVKLHHFMVDYIVVAPPDCQNQSLATDEFRPELTGEIKKPMTAIPPLPLSIRKICASRAAKELQPGFLINLGIGMPQGVASAAAEMGLHQLMFSTESGVLGGVPLTGLDMGAAINPEAIYKTADILDLYDGGCLDLAVLGLAEMDRFGNVNVSKFNGRVVGPGGFIDISQNTGHIIFLGSFTAGGLKTTCADGTLKIVQEGAYKKFKDHVEQITFSAEYATAHHQIVQVITERAVFTLTEKGLMLTEVAPGIDLEKDILGQMEFNPLIAPDLKEMDEAFFITHKKFSQ